MGLLLVVIIFTGCGYRKKDLNLVLRQSDARVMLSGATAHNSLSCNGERSVALRNLKLH
jgi:hypothetical protein